ncbi:MAG: ROK family protein, partial [Planctomycetota bacterium]
MPRRRCERRGDSLNAIGIDLGGTNLRAAVVSEEGGILENLRQPVADPGDGEGIVDAVTSLVQALARRFE